MSLPKGYLAKISGAQGSNFRVCLRSEEREEEVKYLKHPLPPTFNGLQELQTSQHGVMKNNFKSENEKNTWKLLLLQHISGTYACC